MELFSGFYEPTDSLYSYEYHYPYVLNRVQTSRFVSLTKVHGRNYEVEIFTMLIIFRVPEFYAVILMIFSDALSVSTSSED